MNDNGQAVISSLSSALRVTGIDRGITVPQGIHAEISLLTCTDQESDNDHEGGCDGRSILKAVDGNKKGKSWTTKPHDIVKEAKVLKILQHPNVIELLKYTYDDCRSRHELVFPLLAFPLSTFFATSLKDSAPWTGHSRTSAAIETATDEGAKLQADMRRLCYTHTVRSLTYQIVSGVAYLHQQGVYHRDLKPDNILIGWDGSVKIIDLGICWTDVGMIDGDKGEEVWTESADNMCCEVGTGPYRAPELLFGPITYNPEAIDLWPLGTILAEFISATNPMNPSRHGVNAVSSLSTVPINREPLFDSTFGAIGLAGSIFRKLGSPTKANWPEFETLPDARKIEFTSMPSTPLSSHFPQTQIEQQDLFLNLVSQFLVYSPSKRLPAVNGLEHGWFTSNSTSGILLPYSVIRHYMDDPDKSDCVFDMEFEVGDRWLALIDLLSPWMSDARWKWGLDDSDDMESNFDPLECE